MVRWWEHSTGDFHLNPSRPCMFLNSGSVQTSERQFSSHTTYSIISSVELGQHLLTKHINISLAGCVSIHIMYAYSHMQLVRIIHSFMALHGPDFATKVSCENFSVFRAFSALCFSGLGVRVCQLSFPQKRDSWAWLCEGAMEVPQPTTIDSDSLGYGLGIRIVDKQPSWYWYKWWGLGRKQTSRNRVWAWETGGSLSWVIFITCLSRHLPLISVWPYSQVSQKFSMTF